MSEPNKKNDLKGILEEMRERTAAERAAATDPQMRSPEKTQEELDSTNAMIAGALKEVGENPIIHEIPEGILPEQAAVEKMRRVPDMGVGEEGEPPKDPWTRTVPELGKVTVTAAEWESFYRNFLLGLRQKIVTKIEVLPGEFFECVIQNLTPGEKELLALAVTKIVKDHPITLQQSEGATRMLNSDCWLKLEVITRILKITGHEWTPYLIQMGDDMLPEEYPNMEALIKTSRTRFNNNHLFTLLIRSLHLAAVKFTILEDALANRDFTNPVNVD